MRLWAYKTISETETCIEIEKTQCQFLVQLFLLSRHTSTVDNTNHQHPVTHRHTEVCGALRYAAMPQSCLAHS